MPSDSGERPTPRGTLAGPHSPGRPGADSVLREIRVVHVRRQPFTLYIGRKCREFRDSKWRDPFSGIDRFKNIRDYEQYVRMSSLMDCLHELDGQTLGCWCHPKACHGDVLKRLREEQLERKKQ